MHTKLFLLALSMLFFTTVTYAADPAIMRANNQAFVDGQFGYHWLQYSGNHPADAGAPLYRAQGGLLGAQVGVTKSFAHIYSQFLLEANRATVNYSEYGVNNARLTNGSAVLLSPMLRLGYRFDTKSHFAMTPYLTGGYANSQLNTGGYSAPFIALPYNGATLVTQYFYYGLGLLNQWAANPDWVLSADVQLGSQYHPWVNGNVNNFNIPPGATTVWQKWHLSPGLVSQFDVGSDYHFAKHLHMRTHLAYTHNNLNGENSSSSGVFSAQTQNNWVVNVGLGYDFAADNAVNQSEGGGQKAIHAVNNQASLQLGYQREYFTGGTTANSYKQNGSLPAIGVMLSKTWRALYAQLTMTNVFGDTAYKSSTIYNTILTIAAKLGYQFASSENVALTPYATLGYHRWSQAMQGTPNQTVFMNGSTDTYQQGLLGLGLLGQWAIMPRWVVSLDASLGSTFNASLRAWTPSGLTVYTPYNVGNAGYGRAALNADYALTSHWHAQAGIDYLRYSANASNPNILAVSARNTTAQQTSVHVGLGYAFG